MEHGVYLSGWSQSPEGFVLWVKSRPSIRAAGPTYSEAEELLICAIQDAGGAMQAVLEFDPPLPKSTLESKYSEPEIYLIGGADRFETDAASRVAFESEAEVDECYNTTDDDIARSALRKHALSRSERRLRVSHGPSAEGPIVDVTR